MVRTVAALEVELHLQRGQAQKILERHEVGAAAERRQLHFVTVLTTPASLDRLAQPLLRTPAIVNGSGAIVMRHITRYLHQEVAQRRRAAAVEAAPHRQVSVDVDNRLLAQLRLHRLGVLSGSDQAELLRIPEGKDDGPLGLPAGSDQRREATRDLEHRAEPGAGIHSAKAPRIVMRAEDDPTIGVTAGDPADDVADRAAARVHLHIETHRHRARAQPIRERQSALEAGA